MENQRLDILIYGHDGRGLGHVGRSIGVGMALRRLYPQLKILFVSGCRMSQELIGSAPLDWLKLPAYETKVVDGKSRGVAGKSLFTDCQLGSFRGKELEFLLSLYRPRLVLVDHTPQGKHRELIAALATSQSFGTRWILGVRGVIGDVSQARSELAGHLFSQYYHGLLWYGDRKVLGDSHMEQLKLQYGKVPLECGYVSRLAELAALKDVAEVEKSLAGTVSVPWLGEKSLPFLGQLAKGLADVPESYGKWHIFVELGDSVAIESEIKKMFAGLTHCRLEQPGQRYVAALLRSKTALIYGGYNSLMDVLHVGIPALVVQRDMRDNEQQIHIKRLIGRVGDNISTITETAATGQQISSLLRENLSKDEAMLLPVNLGGAMEAAMQLNEYLDEKP